VYSLGWVLFHALTGQLPFAHESDLENLWAHVHEPVPDLRAVRSDVPAPLIDAIAVAMTNDPDERPASAGTFARMARAAVGA
jgi:serine/threonine-protein kinase